MFGRTIDPRHAVIIGDTPHDVSCARAHGLRSLAVATGVFSVDQLSRTDADRVVPSLADTTDILAWLIRQPERVA
jgi:phosphoglycolate phosphatase-like HAD superfamily hydrolase